MAIDMIASKRTRVPSERGWAWVDPGQPYTVASEKTADFHEETGRGTRAKPAKAAKPGKGEQE